MWTRTLRGGRGIAMHLLVSARAHGVHGVTCAHATAHALTTAVFASAAATAWLGLCITHAMSACLASSTLGAAARVRRDYAGKQQHDGCGGAGEKFLGSVHNDS